MLLEERLVLITNDKDDNLKPFTEVILEEAEVILDKSSVDRSIANICYNYRYMISIVLEYVTSDHHNHITARDSFTSTTAHMPSS